MPKHLIVVGLGFGDEGKGSMVDYLARQVDRPLIVRFNGGSQAAHNVVLPDKTHHTFSQFGSGTLAGAPTLLSQFSIVNPINIVDEALHLASIGVPDPMDRLYIHEDALVITPYHIMANRMREDARGDGRHGSCGMGIGETVESAMRFPESAVRMRDLEGVLLGDSTRLAEKLAFWRKVKALEMEEIGVDLRGTIFDDPKDQFLQRTVMNLMVKRPYHIVKSEWLQDQLHIHDVIFEGAQGVLLDERIGFHPHTTWSKTTPQNAKLLLGGRDAYTLGVTRTYTTRHGAGPFPTDMGSLGERMFPEKHNGTGEYQGSFRRGGFDALAFEYGIRSMRSQGHTLDGIAVTHLGRVPYDVPVCTRYERDEDYENDLYQKRTKRLSIGDIPTFDDLRYSEACIEAQEMATTTVTGVKPIYEILPKTSDLVSVIEEYSRSRVVIESWGPTHEDKKDFR